MLFFVFLWSLCLMQRNLKSLMRISKRRARVVVIELVAKVPYITLLPKRRSAKNLLPRLPLSLSPQVKLTSWQTCKE